MKEWLKKRAEIIQIITGLIIVMVSGTDLIGKPARLAHIVGIVAGAFAAGAGTGVFVTKRRANKKR